MSGENVTYPLTWEGSKPGGLKHYEYIQISVGGQGVFEVFRLVGWFAVFSGVADKNASEPVEQSAR